MSYDLNWNPKHPGHIVYLLDLSGSMNRVFNGKKLVDVMMDALYSLFDALNDEIIAGDNVLNNFSVSVIGYNSDVFRLYKAEDGDAFNEFIYEAGNKGVLFETQKGGTAEPKYQTYMADAFVAAKDDIEKWINEQKLKGIQVPAPVVINITDGKPEEKGGNAIDKALEAAESLKSITTPDGNVLLFNIHFNPNKTNEKIVLPSVEPKDESAAFLFKASSLVPPSLVADASRKWPGYDISTKSKAMISNETEVNALLAFISWGTSVGGLVKGNVSFVELPKPEL